MSLNQDDVLRELELLPVWQLREPVKTQAAPEVSPAETTAPAEDVTPTAMPEPQLVTEQNQPNQKPPTEDQTDLNPERNEPVIQQDDPDVEIDCQVCGLTHVRKETIFGEGDMDADWFIIGSAPSSRDDKFGVPFAGEAGLLLDNMLAAIKLKRGSNVYLANILKCHSVSKKASSEAVLDVCNPFLQRQIELIKPKVILVLGEFSAQHLLNSVDSLESLRGKQHDCLGVHVIATYHPAYLLRNLTDKAKAWQDLCQAQALMQNLQSEML